jgi:hypothetical protein
MITRPRPICAFDVSQVHGPQIIVGFRPRACCFSLRDRINPGRNFAVDADGSSACIAKPETWPTPERNTLSSASDFLDENECTDLFARHSQRESGHVNVVIVSDATNGRRRSLDAGLGHSKTV